MTNPNPNPNPMLIHIIDFNSTLVTIPITKIINKLKIPPIFQLKIWTTPQINKLLIKQNVLTNFTNYLTKEHLAKHIILYKYGGIYIRKYLLTEHVISTLHTLIVQNKIIYHENIGLFYYSSNSSLCEYWDTQCLIRDDIIIVNSSPRSNHIIRKMIHELKTESNTETPNIPKYSRHIIKHLYNNLPYYDHDSNNPTFNHINIVEQFDPSIISLNGVRTYFKSYFHKIIDALPSMVTVIPYFIYFTNKEFTSLTLVLQILIFCVELLYAYKWKTIHNYLMPEPCTSGIYYPPHKFNIFRKIQKQWKLIREEVLYIYENAPRLDITRTQTDWKGSHAYISSIKDQYGWIKSWGSTDPSIGNTDWLNYGLLYYGTEFSKNITHCPKTIELLREISPYINICGFSLLLPNTVILPHTDDTGIEHESLAMHLGLVVPSNKLCCLAVQDNNQIYCCKEEKEGKMIIFDATHVHGAYNYSNEPRIILYIDFVCSKNQV